jgi:hypothetical protein
MTAMLPNTNGIDSAEDRYEKCVRFYDTAAGRYNAALDWLEASRTRVRRRQTLVRRGTRRPEPRRCGNRSARRPINVPPDNKAGRAATTRQQRRQLHADR